MQSFLEKNHKAKNELKSKLGGDCAHYYSADHNDDNFYENYYWQYTFSFFVSFSFFEKTTGPDRRATCAANAAVPYTHISWRTTHLHKREDNHGEKDLKEKKREWEGKPKEEA